MSTTSPGFAERFWARLERTSADCWLWTGSTTSEGYGIVKVGGRRERTHRVAWHLANGPIPENGRVGQTCKEPACCNPAHLTLSLPEMLGPLERARADAVRKAGDDEKGVEIADGGRWRVWVIGPAGKRHFKRGHSDDPAEALRDAVLARNELRVRLWGVRPDKPGANRPENVRQLFDRYAEMKVLAGKWDGVTLDTFERDWKHYQPLWKLAPDQANDIDLVERLLLQLRQTGNRKTGGPLSIATMKRIRAAGVGPFDWAVRKRWLPYNAFRSVETLEPTDEELVAAMPKPAPVNVPLQVVQAALADPAFGLRMATYCALLPTTGGRRSELHGLRWERVDRDESVILLSEVIVYETNVGTGRKEWRVKPLPKGKRPRALALGPVSMGLLRLLHEEQLGLVRGAGGETLDPYGFCFSDQIGGSAAWIPNTTAVRFERLCRRHGIDLYGFHDFRRLMHTALVEDGFPEELVADRLGHSRKTGSPSSGGGFPTVAAQFYRGRLSPEKDRAMAERIDELIFGVSGQAILYRAREQLAVGVSATTDRRTTGYRAARRKRATALAERQAVCPSCGGPIPPHPGRGRPRTYCSPDCKRAAEKLA
ncbi:MAG: tyrosine-type recombinase/integrase [Actinomycetota bacterium]